jgi:hypothetical protein
VNPIAINVTNPPRSLLFDGDHLVDWASGGIRYGFDGTVERAHINFAYEFDAATVLSNSPWTILYKRLGTKALLLNGQRIVRELNRSFYHAHVYTYPICLLRTGNDRVLVVHCPDEYNRIEFEDVITGERLTASTKREPADFFHSRLQPSPDSKWLLSAGWVWRSLRPVVFLRAPAWPHDACEQDARRYILRSSSPLPNR